MDVLFISDFTIDQNKGGAQVSNSIIIEKGRELGYNITEHDYTSSPIELLRSYDLVIKSNLEIIKRTSPEKFEMIKNMPNGIRLEHDSCHYLSSQERKDLFGNCLKNFFLTSYHHFFFTELYGEIFKDIEIVYDPIDTNVFKKEDKEKLYDVVYCGYLHPLKGFTELINFSKENPDRKIDIFGWGDFNVEEYLSSYENIQYHGQVDHSEVADIFQRSKAVFHNPVVREPFCRMIGEAILCGVEEFIGDTSKIGAYLEFNKVGYEEFKNGCGNAAQLFWDRVKS